MKLLFSGATICSEDTLKRLLLIADEIGFMDRPSVAFDGWGTIGSASEVREYAEGFKGMPVSLSVHSPPSGPANELYRRYILSDLENYEFRGLFLRGLSQDEIFADKFLRAEAPYGKYSGAQVIESLVNDPYLPRISIKDEILESEPFRIADPLGRKDTLRLLLTTASIDLTNAMIISAQSGHTPVTDDPFWGQLLAIRSSSSSYVGGTSSSVPVLGLEVAKAVIPDQALQKLTLDEIMRYREDAKEIYSAWAIELGKLSTSLDGLSPEEMQKEIPRILARDIRPRLQDHRNEMNLIADRLFGDLIKKVTSWEVPALSLAYIANLSFSQAIGAFMAALTPAIPPLVDYVLSRREINRKHSMTYLIGLAKKVASGR